MARPLDELIRDAAKAREIEIFDFVITPGELIMLKQFGGMFVPTADKNVLLGAGPLRDMRLIVSQPGD